MINFAQPRRSARRHGRHRSLSIAAMVAGWVFVSASAAGAETVAILEYEVETCSSPLFTSTGGGQVIVGLVCPVLVTRRSDQSVVLSAGAGTVIGLGSNSFSDSGGGACSNDVALCLLGFVETDNDDVRLSICTGAGFTVCWVIAPGSPGAMEVKA